MNEHTHQPEASSPDEAVAADAETRDPVCGMKVRADSPHRVTYGGQELGFCSARCREKFRAEPARFTGKAKGSAWPFYMRFVQSLKNRSLNMFTLIGLGVSVAYVFSLIAAVFPGIFPPSFREEGKVAVNFEAAAVIVTLILLGHVLELRAHPEVPGVAPLP